MLKKQNIVNDSKQYYQTLSSSDADLLERTDMYIN